MMRLVFVGAASTLVALMRAPTIVAVDVAPVSLPIRVTERNPDKLQDRCQHLLDEIRLATNSDDTKRSAEALSYVNDPIAVPYLTKVINANKLVDSIAILGLERIGNTDARSALEAALTHYDPDTVHAATDALNRLDTKRR